jgi:tRNA A37 N6-isopentenylltransferase MiaA
MRFLSNFQAVTRKYTTRQITWFRKEPRYHYVDVAPTIDTPRDTAEQIAAVFRRSQADEAAQHTEGSTPLQVQQGACLTLRRLKSNGS